MLYFVRGEQIVNCRLLPQQHSYCLKIHYIVKNGKRNKYYICPSLILPRFDRAHSSPMHSLLYLPRALPLMSIANQTECLRRPLAMMKTRCRLFGYQTLNTPH